MCEGSGTLMKCVEQVRGRNVGNWDDLWKDGLTPWDLKSPTPLLVKELTDRPIHARHILVPGCGAGYDLSTFRNLCNASRSSSSPTEGTVVVVGLDISPTSLDRAKQVLHDSIYPSDSTTVVNLMVGDFFTDDWAKMYSTKRGHDSGLDGTTFDFIYDYTFFCALPPNLRPAWGRRTAELLITGGRLLTIMFPILPDADRMVGPPFPVTVEDYQQVLGPHGVFMDGDPFESVASVSSRSGKELVCYWKKAE